MPTTFECVDREVIRSFHLFQLDACNRLQLPAAGDTMLINPELTSFGRKRNITYPTRTNTPTVYGGVCADPPKCATDEGTDLVLGFCREPYALKVLAGLESVSRTNGVVAAAGAQELAKCTKNFAMMITFGPPSQCTSGATPLCRSYIYPLSGEFRSDDTVTWADNTKTKETWTFTGLENPGWLANYATYASLPQSIRDRFSAVDFGLLQSGKVGMWADVVCPPDVSAPCQTLPIA